MLMGTALVAVAWLALAWAVVRIWKTGKVLSRFGSMISRNESPAYFWFSYSLYLLGFALLTYVGAFEVVVLLRGNIH
jgi:hypothetical protein